MSEAYRRAGVDIDAGEALVARIKDHARATHTPHVVGGIGGFAGLCALPEGMSSPLLVSGTDGVGTKLKLAEQARDFAGIGIDLVAMCINDIITCGAKPLFFLDYLATGKLDVEEASQVVASIAQGCKEADCALLGGETAELPGMMNPGTYELAGFAVGVVERDAMLTGRDVQAGDVLVGLASSGLHANGYSLARQVLCAPNAASDRAADLLRPGALARWVQLEGSKAGDGDCDAEAMLRALLAPTRIYVAALRAALEAGGVRAVAHITGGGLVDNLPRVLPSSVRAVIDSASWTVPSLFRCVQELGKVPEADMRRTFNMGVGMVLVVEASRVEAVMHALRTSGEQPWRLGALEAAAAEHPVNAQTQPGPAGGAGTQGQAPADKTRADKKRSDKAPAGRADKASAGSASAGRAEVLFS